MESRTGASDSAGAPGVNRSGAGYPRSVRLRKNPEFQKVYVEGVRASDALMTVIVAIGEGPTARFGVSAGRKIGKATRRNRAKRLLRETFRQTRESLPGKLDIVAVPRRPCTEEKLDNVMKSFKRLVAVALGKLQR